MKLSKAFTITLLISLCTTLNAQWKIKYFVDDFGDKTNDNYITYLDNNGTFSNSAAKNAKLLAQIIISYTSNDSFPEIRFDLNEYGTNPAVGKAIGFATYKLTIKMSDNSTELYYLQAESNSLHFNPYSSRDILSFIENLIKEIKPIKCYIHIDGEYSNETYNFKINPLGFKNALEKIKPSKRLKTE